MEHIEIDPEFRALIPPLTTEERRLLEASIEEFGIIEPLIVWMETDLLLDGHNRYEIAERDGHDFRVERISLGSSREDARLWILEHQLGRRNLTDAARIKLAVRVEEIYRLQARRNMSAGGAKAAPGRPAEKGLLTLANLSPATDPDPYVSYDPPRSPVPRPPAPASITPGPVPRPPAPRPPAPGPVPRPPLPPVNTRAEVAKLAGVSQETYRKGKAVLESDDEETKQAYESGAVTTNAAFNRIFREEEPAPQKLAHNLANAVKAIMAMPDPDEFLSMFADEDVGGLPRDGLRPAALWLESLDICIDRFEHPELWGSDLDADESAREAR